MGGDSRCFADTTARHMFHTPKINSLLLTLQVVLSCVEGSPAERAGIHDGDELMEINGILPSEISFQS
jgi:C-terminal processing protease CtpA/Prc